MSNKCIFNYVQKHKDCNERLFNCAVNVIWDINNEEISPGLDEMTGNMCLFKTDVGVVEKFVVL